MEYCEDTKNGELLEDKLSSSTYAVQEKDAAESDYYVATWKFQLTSASAIECPQKFTVNDNVTPICSAEAISLAPTDATACSYEVSVEKPAITENCTVSKVEYSLTDGGSKTEMTGANFKSTFPVGSSTVYWTVTDNHNNVGFCTTSINIEDKTKPVCSSIAPIAKALKTVCDTTIELTFTGTDNCGITNIRYSVSGATTRSEERRVGKECRL